MAAPFMTHVCLTALCICFDIHYFIRGIFLAITVLLGRICNPSSKRHPMGEFSVSGICLTTDLDFMWHMNNARYLRECDFARMKLFVESGIGLSLRQTGGRCLLGGSTIRYRRSLNLFETFQIKTKVLCWDEKAFYAEQKIVSRKDNFISAIVLAKMSCIKVTPQEVMLNLLGESAQSPAVPDEVQKWIESNQISSNNLRKSM